MQVTFQRRARKQGPLLKRLVYKTVQDSCQVRMQGATGHKLALIGHNWPSLRTGLIEGRHAPYRRAMFASMVTLYCNAPSEKL